MTNIAENLQKLNITLPTPVAPVANYVGYNISGNQIFISGQLPIDAGQVKYIGKVPSKISVEDAKKAAEICAINILAQANLACQENFGGGLEKIKKCVRLGVFVNADADFCDHPIVANGASDLMVAILGNAGRHARAATGAGSLPRGVSVEIDAIFEV